MNHTTIISQEATKAIDRLDRKTERRIQSRLDELTPNPFAERVSKPVTTFEGLRVSRVGDWRIFYIVNEAERKIFITAVYHRGEAYRKI